MKFWYKKSFLTILLKPLSYSYRMLISIRRFAYRSFLKPQPFRIPIIVIGNISVGGTGKTPLVIALIERFNSQGIKVGVVSRGYGAKTKTFPHFVNPKLPATLCADEPYLIARRTGAPVCIDPNRPRAVKHLLSRYPDCQIILSDDGLQHYALYRDYEIALIDLTRQIDYSALLPAGALREPLKRLNEVDCLIGRGQLSEANLPIKLTPSFFSMTLNPIGFRLLADWNRLYANPGCLKEKPLVAIAGIGNPDAFFGTLKTLGLSFESHAFPDHHIFLKKDFDAFIGKQLIMTEKDAVKCLSLNLPDAWCLVVDAILPDVFYENIYNRFLDPKDISRC